MACRERAAWEPDATEEEIRELGDRLALDAEGEDEYVYYGPCPRCCHRLEIRLSRRTGLLRDEERRVPVRAECKCPHGHDGRPADDKTGCGFDAVYKVPEP